MQVSIMSVTLDAAHYHREEQCHRQAGSVDKHVQALP